MSDGALFGCHMSTFQSRATKLPLGKTSLIKSIAVNLGGDLLPYEAGNIDYAKEHFEGRKSCEITLGGIDYAPVIYNVALGANIAQLASIASTTTIQELDKKNTQITLATDPDAVASLFFGTFALYYNGTGWDHYVLDDSGSIKLIGGTDLNIGPFAIPVTVSGGSTPDPISIGNGLTAILPLATEYTPAEGDFYSYRVIPANPAAQRAFQVTVQDRQRRPSVTGYFAAESQGSLFSIRIPKMKCSSGLPINLTEKTVGEWQISFMASLADGENLVDIQQVDYDR